jgi:cytochrome P450/ferredoxin
MASGHCAAIVPEIFFQDESGLSALTRKDPPRQYHDQVYAAAAACPGGAITVEEEDGDQRHGADLESSRRNPSGVAAMNIDFFSRKIAADPYPILEEVRSHGPIVWNENTRSWMVTNDVLCRKIMINFSKFTMAGTLGEDLFGLQAFICMDDKKRHDKLRGVWAAAFQRSALEPLRGVILKCAEGLLAPLEERIRDGETVEIYRTFCRDLPAYIIAEMLGVPPRMRKSIVEWSDAMAEEVSAYGDQTARVASENAKADFALYLEELIQERRRAPADDLVSRIVVSEVAKTMADSEIMQNVRQLLFAGNETTARWLSSIIVTMARYPDARRNVIRDPTLLPVAIEEVMRWDPTVQADARMTRGEPIELGGVELSEGHHLHLMFGAANRDPAKYENPGVFDIHREQKGHLGFGFGLHNCLGVTLARLEAAVTIGHLLDRLPNYELAGEVDYGDSFIVRGPQIVPIALG